MATRFAVAAGTWDATNTSIWAATSGGAAGASAPTAADNVVFDAASGAVTVTAASGAVANNLTATGFTGQITGATITLNGTTVTLGSGMTATGFIASLQPGAGNTVTFTSSGRTVNSLNLNNGTLSLADAMTMTGNLNHALGAVVTNNFAFTTAGWQSNVSTTRVITLGSSSVTITGGNNAWLVGQTGLTMTANTATVTMSNVAGGFNHLGGNMVGAALVWSGNTSGNIANPVVGLASLTINGTASKTGTFLLVGNVTMTGAFTVNGNSVVNRLLIQSNAIGTARTVSAGSVASSNADYMDITAAGAASWDLSAATGGAGDAGGNTGITFTTSVTQFWRNNGGNWSDATHWSLTSGGGATGRVPLPQDNVVFDANSFTATGQVATADMPRLGADISFTGTTNNPGFSPSVSVTVNGSLTLINGMAYTGGQTVIFVGRGTHTVTSAGKTFPSNGTGVSFNGPGGSYTLQDALTTAGAFIVNAGTVNTNNVNVTCLSVVATGSITRAFTLGTSTVSLTGTNGTVWNVASTGLTLSVASSTITMSVTSGSLRQMILGGLTYGTISYTVSGSTGTMQMSGSATIGTLNVSGAARILQFGSGTTITVANWNVFGLVGAVITINASTPASAATLSKASGYIASDYVSVQDITGTGGATFYMGSRSTSVSGNTGLTFTDAPQRFWVGGTATWDATVGTKWAVVSGGTGGLAVPTASDNVYLDANSGAGTVTAAGGSVANGLTLTATGFTGTLAGGTINITGSVTLAATMSSSNLSFTLSPPAGTTAVMTSAGKTLSTINIGGTATSGVALADALSVIGTLILTRSITTNNFAIACGSIDGSNLNTRTYSFGSSSITLTGTASSTWNTSTATGLTVTANTATVMFTGTAGSVTLFNSASSVNYNGLSLVFSGVGQPILTAGGCTLANVTRTGTTNKTDSLQIGGNFTITGTLTLTGNSATSRVLLSSSTFEARRTITAANVVASNADFQDIAGAGAASWDLSAITGGSGDALGNTGITFTASATQYWHAGGSASWSNINSWSATSGGAGGTGRVPLPQDDVRFDAPAFTGAGQTVTADMPRLGRDIDWTGATNNPTYSQGTTTASYGSITWVSGMTVTGGSQMNLAGRSTHTITSAGKTFPSSGLVLNSTVGTYAMQDALAAGGTFQVQGTLTTNSFNVSVSTVAASGTMNVSGVGTINGGTSTFSLMGTSAANIWSTSAGTTLNMASSTVVIASASANTRTFIGSGKSYGTITYTVAASTGALVITGANTFGTINVSGGARTLTLPASTTTTVTNWSVFGTAGNLVTVHSSTPGTAATLAKGDSILTGSDYLSIQDVTASPGSTWYAGSHSVDVSGNTDWTFTDPPISSSASLTLTATGASAAPVASSAALSLSATNSDLAGPAAGAAALVLTGSAAATVPTTGSASIVLTAAATARTPITGTAAVTLVATATPSAPVTSSAAIVLTATATARAAVASAAQVTLTAVALGTSSSAASVAALTLAASVVTGYLGLRDIQVSFGVVYDKFTTRAPADVYTTGVPSI